MHLTGRHASDCLFVLDGGRSACTCWPETQIEREQLKQTTMNDLGSILGRCEIRLQHIENKQDWLAETMDRMLGSLENRLIEHLSVESQRNLEINAKLDRIIYAMIDRIPVEKQPVRRATRKGKRR